MPLPFVPFGPSHLAAIAVTLLAPLALALVARHEHLGRHADRVTRTALATLLESYNSDNCACPTAESLQSSSATPVPSTTTKASWGKVKSIYR